MAIKTYPLNDIEYQAEDAELFHCTRTSGVYAYGHFPISVTGADNNITIGKGIGWIKNTEFSGKVFASKEETVLNAGVPDASLPRVDAVVVRFDANQNETYFTIKQGSVGSTPTTPAVERNEYNYELHLYHIRRRPGATAITPGDITDLRMDANYCGLMADSVTQVDMSAINAQVREFITDWENQIANVTDGKMIESPEYPGCYYRMNRGVKEWLNPPMMEDVEYPTTKRQDGKRVYTKLLKARSHVGSVSLPDIERIVSVFAVAERDWNGEKLMFQLPVDSLPKDAPTIQKMQVYYHGNRIEFESVTKIGLYNLYITVEYTKTGDEVAYTNVTADGDTVYVETNGNVSAQGDNLNVEMFTTVSADGGAYIRRLTINGVAYDLAVGQAGSGAPGRAYPGVPGMFYTNIDSGAVYVCLRANPALGIYVWSDIIPENLYVKNIKFRHDIGIGYAEITADKQVVNIQNDGADAVVRGVAAPVNANDAANKQYVDSAMRSGSGFGDLFSGYDRFYDSIARLRVNPTAPLDIDTYDGSGQLTHPCVRYFPDGWCAHKYWMAASPYPNSAIDLENPCLWYSDDGYNWSEGGVPNPLALPPEEDGVIVGYNSDPHLLLRLDGVMEVWWRTLYHSGSNAGCEVIYRRTSADGVSWTATEELHRVQNIDGTNIACMCPVALHEDDIYRIWVVYKQQYLRYYESSTGADWQHVRDIDVSNHEYPEYKVWHFDINHTDKGHEFVGSYNIPGDHTSHKYICYAVSEDNITYSERVMILSQGVAGSFDERLLYRPTIIRLDNKVMIYYGANDANNSWHIGQIEAPSAYLFNAVLTVGERIKIIESKNSQQDGRLTALESGGGAAEGQTIVNSFNVSPWVEGYWKPEDNGAMTIYGNFHHTQLVPLANLMDGGEFPNITAISSVASYPVLRVNYFDGNLRWIGFDSGEADPTQSGKQLPTPINWPAGAVYFAISANTASKDDITITIN